MTFRFRESFRGYNKDDVNSYIEQLSQRYAKKEAELNAKINSMQSVGETSFVPVQNDNVQNDGLNEAVNALTEENNNLKAQIALLKVENEGLVSLNALSENDATVKESEEQAKRVVSDAEEKAIKILDDANASSESMISEAKEKYNAIIAEAEKEKESQLAEVKRQYEVLAERYASECAAFLSGMQSKIDAINEKLLGDADAIIKETETKFGK